MFDSVAGKRILVVVAHPDDEVLGLGGTMNRLIHDFGCDIKCIILGEGLTSRSEKRNTQEWSSELSRHHQNASDASKLIGYSSLKTFDFPDNRFDSVPLLEIVKTIESEKKDFLPDVIFTHHGGDVNIDHQRTFEAVVTAVRPVQDELVRTLITFETPSGTEWRASSDPKHFIPNFFSVIDESNLEAKIKAMECYEYEKRPFPHPRSPEALRTLAKRWGIVIGSNYAEAFQIIRTIC